MVHIFCISKLNVLRKVEPIWSDKKYRVHGTASHAESIVQPDSNERIKHSVSPKRSVWGALLANSHPDHHNESLSVKPLPPSQNPFQHFKNEYTNHTLVSRPRVPSVQRTSSNTKNFAYLILGGVLHDDRRLRSSDSRDIFYLTFKEKASEESEFIVYSPTTTWTTARNELLQLALVKNVSYQYYIFLDDDILAMIQGENPWGDFEHWLLHESPSTAYMTRSVWWHRVGSGPVTTGTFNVDAIIHAFHKSTLGYLLPYDPSLDSQSWYYSQYILNTQISTFYPGPKGRMGWNLATFDHSKNLHSGEPKYKRSMDWPMARRYVEQSVAGRVKLRQEDWNPQESHPQPDMGILRNMTLLLSSKVV